MPFIVVIYKTPIIQITFEIFMKHSSHIERWIKKKAQFVHAKPWIKRIMRKKCVSHP